MSTAGDVRHEAHATEALAVTSAVARIRAHNGTLSAFVTTRLEEALARDAELAQKAPRSPLYRVPYALKDLWDTAGIPTTGGSHRYLSRVPATSSPVFEAFEDAGAVLMGKTNLSDMSLPPEATSYVGGATRNPYDLERTAGGSSGGAACAVADGMVVFDWGSDFGGSIRMPAAFCGVLGMRLSSETWPVRGSFPDGPESVRWMNGQGPITRTTGVMRTVLATAAPRLRTGTTRQFTLRGAAIWPPDRGRWPTFAADVTPHLYRAAGEVEPAPLPPQTQVRNLAFAMYGAHFEEMAAMDPMPLPVGVRAALSALVFRGRFGDKRLHPTTAGLMMLMALGRLTLFRSKEAAQDGAAGFRARVAELWDRGLLVATPVCCFPPPRIGRTQRNKDLLSCTVGGNLSDATSIAIPFGSFEGGLPRALQLMGPPGSEQCLLDVAERLIASRETDPSVAAVPPPARLE